MPFGCRTEEICDPIEAGSVGWRIPYSLELPVPKVLTLCNKVPGRIAASVEADACKVVPRVTLEYGAWGLG